ncbi:hypothetical protein [Terrabacter sp. BE26]|uniref:hypothetical protein n=1 Tax=Terrabacter sp. BE26 TaxID=2898152 RepID=UPI0035BE6C3B
MPGQRLTRLLNVVTGEVEDRVTSARLATTVPYRVDVQAWRGAPRARLEFSAPRLLRGDNRCPATPQEVLEVVRRAYDEVGEHLPWLCDVAGLSVERLDLARDFEGVVDGPLLLDELSRVPAVRMGTQTFRSPEHSGTQTVVRETTRHRGQLYCRDFHYLDRARQTRSAEKKEHLRTLAAADRGVVRFELRLWHQQAVEAGAGSLSELTSSPLEDVAKRFFLDRCRFGEVVAGPASKLRQAAEALTIAGAGKELVTAFGQWALDALGLDPGRHPQTASTYRRRYQGAGLTPSDLWAVERAPVRFDWALGRVVAAHSVGRAAA